MTKSEATAGVARSIEVGESWARLFLFCKAAARLAPIRRVCTRRCTRSASNPTG